MKRSDYVRQRQAFGKRRRTTWRIILAVLVILILAPIIYRLPPVYSRLSWRIDELRSRIVHAFNPPDEAIFSSEDQWEIELMVQATLKALTPTFAPPPSTPQPNATPSLTPTPTITPTPLPEYKKLEGVVYVDQHGGYNLCAPANLTMALKFWGWPGSRYDVTKVIKPGINDPNLEFYLRGKPDKNVMPSEMRDFVIDYSDFNVVIRYGGDIDLVKRFVANGFPVLIEMGYLERSYAANWEITWMGHYLFVTGYDESEGAFIVQDAYKDDGKNLLSDYEVFSEGWRSFNYLFMVIYPPEYETQIFDLLGPWADNQWANQHALDIAYEEGSYLEGIDKFFAWFNVGTSHVKLLEYDKAAFAYDNAFLLYDNLEGEEIKRPYRIMWYQTGPYWAYYYTGQYERLIELATHTLDTPDTGPTLEESLYWRGRAYLATGQNAKAIDDFLQAVWVNPNFAPGWEMLNQLGVNP